MRQLNISKFISRSTLKLASTYLAIIMLMSVGFSLIFYQTSAAQLGRQVPAEINYEGTRIGYFFVQRLEEGKHDLVLQLIWINIATLIAGSLVSFLLARKTLIPIEEAIAAQNRFVSDASHELRTPITALQTTNEVALRKNKLSEKEARQLISYNLKEATKLHNLTNSLLSLLRQDSLIIQPISIQQASTEAINNVLSQAIKKKIAINDKTKNDYALADQAALEQILTILFDNAIKYSPSGSEINLISDKKGNFIFLKITDSGIGISSTDLPYIFDRFYRADNARTSSEDSGGYGLGLSIAKQITDSLKGEITVKSKTGKGSTFFVKLPSASKIKAS